LDFNQNRARKEVSALLFHNNKVMDPLPLISSLHYSHPNPKLPEFYASLDQCHIATAVASVAARQADRLASLALCLCLGG
jgi:hypothetical protein